MWSTEARQEVGTGPGAYSVTISTLCVCNNAALSGRNVTDSKGSKATVYWKMYIVCQGHVEKKSAQSICHTSTPNDKTSDEGGSSFDSGISPVKQRTRESFSLTS